MYKFLNFLYIKIAFTVRGPLPSFLPQSPTTYNATYGYCLFPAGIKPRAFTYYTNTLPLNYIPGPFNFKTESCSNLRSSFLRFLSNMCPDGTLLNSRSILAKKLHTHTHTSLRASN